MAAELLVDGQHPGSQRRAMVAHEIGSIWLYLTAPGSYQSSGDCWLFNHGTLPPAVDFRAEGSPPPAHTPLPPVPTGEFWASSGRMTVAVIAGTCCGRDPGGSHSVPRWQPACSRQPRPSEPTALR